MKNVVTGNWVRLKCQYGCGGYGETLTCPPYSPTPAYTQKMLQDYQISLLLVYHVEPENEDEVCKKIRETVASLERDVFLDGYYKAFGMGAGPCNLCPQCDVNESCKYPHIARPSLEACGIDVFQTLRNVGIEIEVAKSYKYPCTLCGMVLIE